MWFHVAVAQHLNVFVPMCVGNKSATRVTAAKHRWLCSSAAASSNFPHPRFICLSFTLARGLLFGPMKYTVFKVDGSALFQSARIDGADFLNFDTRKGRDIHPRYFCGPRHLCQKMFQGCAIYARILKSKVSKPPFPFSSPFALNFPFLLPPFPFSFPSPLSFLLSLSPPFPPPFHLPLQMERFGNL